MNDKPISINLEEQLGRLLAKIPDSVVLKRLSIRLSLGLLLWPLIYQIVCVDCRHIWLNILGQLLILWSLLVLFLVSPLCDFLYYLCYLGGFRQPFNDPNIADKYATLTKIFQGTTNDLTVGTETIRGILEMFKERMHSWRPFLMLTLAILVGQVIDKVLGMYRIDYFSMHAFETILMTICVFPILSLVMITVCKSFQNSSKLITEQNTSNKISKFNNGFLRSVNTAIVPRITRFCSGEFPIMSVYLAFLTCITMISFWPATVGYHIARWILASATDANLDFRYDYTYSDEWFVYGTSVLLWLILYRAFIPFVWRLGAFYQLLLQKLTCRSADSGLIEALSDAIASPRNKINIRPQHPHLRSLKESLQWIIISYAILFSLVAFCPGTLGKAITGWLNASILDASPVILDLNKLLHQKMPWCTGTTGFSWIIKYDASGRGQVSVVPWGGIHTVNKSSPGKKPELESARWYSIHRRANDQEITGVNYIGPNPNHWNFKLADHYNLRLFLASVIAAFGTAPFAIMTCAFLPLRRPDEAYVSEQGFLQPNKLIGSPLLLWPDLRKVSLLNTNKPQRSQHVLKLVFRPGRTIKMRLNTISKENLSEILAMADEYAPNCQFDDEAVKLRQELLKENQISLAAANKFESTIFHPHIAGDKIHGGQIRIIRKLASKPLSAVYLARNEKSNLIVAKQFVTPNNNAVSAKYEEMFKREHQIISLLSHPMMAKFIETFEDNGANYLVIEHIAGENLRTFIERHGPRSEKVAVGWASQICHFMQYLHRQNPPVLHRDLTPDNIMLDDTGRIRIVDFGAAHQFMEGITGTLIGKQCYIAPEQLRGKANIQSDIYSFGCTVYFLLTGKDPKALSQSDLTETYRKISPQLQELVKNCTEFDDSKRLNSFEEISLLLKSIAINNTLTKLADSSQKLSNLKRLHQELPQEIKEIIS